MISLKWVQSLTNFPGCRFIPELHLRHLGFTYSVFEPFSKHCERIQKSKDTGNLKHIEKMN